MAKRKRRRLVEVDVLAEIESLATIAGASGSAIHRTLAADERFADRELPSERTVQDIVRELDYRDDSEPWSLTSAAMPDEGALVMPVLGELIRREEVEQTHITRAEADWIVRIRRAAPDMPLFATYRFARFYLALEDSDRADGLAVGDLDAVMALRPWSDEAWTERGKALLDAGRLSWPALLEGAYIELEAGG